MSQATVEIVKRAIDAFNRRDIEGLVELTTTDFKWFPAMPGIVAGDSFTGREGIESYIREVSDTWEE